MVAFANSIVKTTLKAFGLSLLFFNSHVPLMASTLDPHQKIGEQAAYNLNPDSQRTNSLVRAGSGALKVLAYEQDRDTYILKLEYDLNIRLIGVKKGFLYLRFPAEILAPDMYDRLERDQSIQFADMKLRHYGRKTVQTISGVSYRDCHDVLVSDINMENVVVELPDAPSGDSLGISDLVLRLKGRPDLPAAGAAMIDITAKTSGISVKAGLDLLPQG